MRQITNFLSHIVEDLNLSDDLLHNTTTIYNDNMATIHWIKNKTSKNIHHLQIRENEIQESVAKKFVKVKNVDGKINLAEIFTKEDKDLSHFIRIPDKILSRPFPPQVEPKTNTHFF